MIENLRKYPGVILAALVAVFIGFLLMDSQRFFRQSGHNAISINGTSYDINEYNRLGPSSQKLCSMLTTYQSMSLYEFAMALVDRNAKTQEAAEKSFFINRQILRNAGKDFGYDPGEKEVQDFIRDRSVFTDSDPTDPSKKSFNKEKYDAFLLNSLGKNGMSQKDLFALIKDMLIYEKLSAVIAGALDVNSADVVETVQSERQKISASYVTLNLADFTAKQDPSEEDVKKFWEERRDSFNTENRRKFSYVIGTPKYPAGAEKAPAPPVPGKPGEAPPEPSAEDKKITEDRRVAERAVAATMDDLSISLEESKGSDFEEQVKKAGWELRVTDLFTSSTIPDELLKLTPRKTQKTVQQLLFSLQTTADPLSKFTTSFPVGEADWLIARLDAEEVSRVKTFEEAKEEARKQLIDQKAREAIKTAAEEVHKKIADIVKAGKSFADASKEAGYTAATIGPIGDRQTVAGQPNAQEIFTAAKHTNPGELTENLITESATLIIAVDKREIYKDPNFDKTIESRVDQAKDSLRIQAFQAWLDEKNASSKVSS